jgi:oxygen-dependent protoporphyrinogen oxidase
LVVNWPEGPEIQAKTPVTGGPRGCEDDQVSSSVIVVGSGISGLSAAYYLRRQLGDDATVTVLDQAPAPGGKIRTRTLAGLAIDTGPDAFLSRAPQLKSLVEGLGLSDEVQGPSASGAFIWSKGSLRPLPAGATFGLPEKVWPLVQSGLISIPGAIRAAMDVVLPATKLPDDPTVEQLVRPRLGGDVFERMVEPLLGGVHAGSAKVLSAKSTVPEIVAMTSGHRSIIGAMKGRKKPPPPPPGTKPAPALVTIKGGLKNLTAALVEAIGPDNVRSDIRVTGLSPRAHGGWDVVTDSGRFTADHVVIATPAYAAADLLAPIDPTLPGLLRSIPYVDTAGVILAFKKSEIPALPHGTGYLVPPIEGDLIVGSTWLTSKWPYLVNDDVVIIRSLVGRYGDTRFLKMTDDELITEVRAAMKRVVGIEAAPIDQLVQRWPAAMPQYVVGHSERLERIDAAMETLPGLHLTGAAYRGVGLAGCVAQGFAVASTISDSSKVEGSRP